MFDTEQHSRLQLEAEQLSVLKLQLEFRANVTRAWNFIRMLGLKFLSILLAKV